MTFGSLFSGIGGLDLGLERSGMTCKWQVERDDYACSILKRHWPDVPRWRDVRYFLGGKRWRKAREAWAVDLICGGFPCQDISNAGKRAGIGGARSGLWAEFARIIRLLRPAYVLVENVPALAVRGLSRVLGDLAALGFDAEWDCLPAAALGAPHRRWRIFIVAHADGKHGRAWRQGRLARHSSGDAEQAQRRAEAAADAGRDRLEGFFSPWSEARAALRGGSDWWATEPALARMVHGIPPAVDGIRGLGNAVVPQVAELIGRRIIAHAEGNQ